MKIEAALFFIIAINFMLFLTQTGITKVATSEGLEGSEFFNYSGSFIGNFDTGNYNLNESVEGILPSGAGQIEPESGNFFTDTFSTIKNWLLQATGVKYLIGIVNAFPNFIKQIGLPLEISFALGFLWHSLTIFLVIMWLKT